MKSILVKDYITISYLVIVLCFGITVKLVSSQEAAVRNDGSRSPQRYLSRIMQTTTSASLPRTIKPRLVSAYSLSGTINGKTIKKQGGGLNVHIIKDRMGRGTQVVTGIVSSFAHGSGRDGSATLEDAFSKYDELMEDIEADLSKAKIGLGLRLEESLKNYKKSTDKFFRQLRSFQGADWGHWTNGANNQNFLPRLDEKEMKKRLMKLNELLNQGFEGFLDMSERGKDVLRRLYKKRYEMRNNLS